MTRPELQLPPNLYYNLDESTKYTNCSRIINIQSQLTERALQLLNLDADSFVLDIGCGSGISGHHLTEENLNWVGIDISESMLQVAVERKVQGELLLCDMGQGFKFRPGVFDAAISISALQWLCVSYKKSERPHKRLQVFFESLKNCLKNNARAVFQFYPDGHDQINMITGAALRAGFAGDIIVDFPNSSKARKMYLVLYLGGVNSTGKTMNIIEGLKDEDLENKVDYISKITRKIKKQHKGKRKLVEKSRQWIVKRKEKQTRLGKKVKPTTKYTGRRRNNLSQFK